MDELERRLGRWVDAGLVTAEAGCGDPGGGVASGEKGPGEARDDQRAPSMAARARLPRRVRGPGRRHRGGLAPMMRIKTGARLTLASAATLSLLAAGFLARRRQRPHSSRSIPSCGSCRRAGRRSRPASSPTTCSISRPARSPCGQAPPPRRRARHSGDFTAVRSRRSRSSRGSRSSWRRCSLTSRGRPTACTGSRSGVWARSWGVLGGGRVLPQPGSAIALGGTGLLLGTQILSFGWRGARLALGIATRRGVLASRMALHRRALLGFGAAGVLPLPPADRLRVPGRHAGGAAGAPRHRDRPPRRNVPDRASQRGRRRRTSDSRTSTGAAVRSRALVLAAFVAAVVVAAIWFFGIMPFPTTLSLRARPDPSIPDRWRSSAGESGPCVFVVAASGGDPRRIRCSGDDGNGAGEAAWLGGPVFWTREGWIVVQAYDPAGSGRRHRPGIGARDRADRVRGPLMTDLESDDP